jgi:hypothetical protein
MRGAPGVCGGVGRDIVEDVERIFELCGEGGWTTLWRLCVVVREAQCGVVESLEFGEKVQSVHARWTSEIFGIGIVGSLVHDCSTSTEILLTQVQMCFMLLLSYFIHEGFLGTVCRLAESKYIGRESHRKA